ncbi:unnamed protein product, partial [Coregonus sp. 'balchen']
VAGMKQEKTQWKDFLENISVLQWILTFLLLGLACIGLMVYLMFTSLCPLLTLYFIWQLKDWHTAERVGAKSEKGNAVVIVIGGAAESLLSLLGVNTVVMKQRQGIV